MGSYKKIEKTHQKHMAFLPVFSQSNILIRETTTKSRKIAIAYLARFYHIFFAKVFTEIWQSEEVRVTEIKEKKCLR